MGENHFDNGTSEIILEERDQTPRSIYKIKNKEDIKEIQKLDDLFEFAEEIPSPIGKLHYYSNHSRTHSNKRFSHLKSISKMQFDPPKEDVRRLFNFSNAFMMDSLNRHSLTDPKAEEAVGQENLPLDFLSEKTENVVLLRKPSTEKQVENLRKGEEMNIFQFIVNESDPPQEAVFDTHTSMGIGEAYAEQLGPEHVEQLLFISKRGGFHKRQLKYGIIDFLTLFTMKKRAELIVKKLYQKNPSVAEPHEYAQRFLNCMKKVFN